MARFDVYRLASKSAPLVLDVQSDVLGELASRVVIPLLPEAKVARELMPRLKPTISIEGKGHTMMTTDMGAIPVRQLGEFVTNVEGQHRDDITNAIDFLFLGF